MPNRHPQKKKSRKLLCFKCKKLCHMSRNCLEPPLGPCHEFSKTGGYQWHWRMDCPYSQKRALSVKTLGLLAETAHDWGGLGCSQQPLHKFVITYDEPQVSLEVLGKQILFLIDTRVHCSVLPAFSGKPLSQTAIVVMVDWKNKIRNFTSLLPCHIDTQFFMHTFLIVPSCPTPLLGQDIMDSCVWSWQWAVCLDSSCFKKDPKGSIKFP
jgi:hypothetical protein